MNILLLVLHLLMFIQLHLQQPYSTSQWTAYKHQIHIRKLYTCKMQVHMYKCKAYQIIAFQKQPSTNLVAVAYCPPVCSLHYRHHTVTLQRFNSQGCPGNLSQDHVCICFEFNLSDRNTKFWASSTAYQSQNMYIMLRVCVLKPYMLSKFCEYMALTTPNYRWQRLLLPSWRMSPVPGEGSPVQLIDNTWKHLATTVINAASLQPICRPLQICALQMTRSYLSPSSECST